MSINDVLLEILNIVSYKDDKELFIKNFLANCTEETYLSLVNNLPKEALLELNKMIDVNNTDRNYIKEIIDKYYTQDTIIKELGTTEAKKTIQFMQMHMANKDPEINEKLLALMSNIRASLR